MADFPTIRDDTAIINSIIKNRNTSAVGELKQSSESASTNYTRDTQFPKPVNRRSNRRHKGDRRKNNRRQTRQNTLLNTRSNHERRKGDRRDELDNNEKPQLEDNASIIHGVDILV